MTTTRRLIRSESLSLKAYSEDIRLKVVKAYQNGEGSLREIAKRFDVSLSFARDLMKRYRNSGSVAPTKSRRRISSKVHGANLKYILQIHCDDPTLPISSLCARLAQERHLQISRATMWRTLRRHSNRTQSPVSRSLTGQQLAEPS